MAFDIDEQRKESTMSVLNVFHELGKFLAWDDGKDMVYGKVDHFHHWIVGYLLANASYLAALAVTSQDLMRDLENIEDTTTEEMIEQFESVQET